MIDSTTTICPVTATALSADVGNSAPLQTLTVTLTNSSVVSEWTSTITAPVSTTILSADSPGTLSYVTISAASSSSSQPSQPGNTLASPEDATKTETSSVIKSTSFVYATVTLPANASSTAFGPSSFANSVSFSGTLSAYHADHFLDCHDHDHFCSVELLYQCHRCAHWHRKQHFQLLGQWHIGNCKSSTSLETVQRFGDTDQHLLANCASCCHVRIDRALHRRRRRTRFDLALLGCWGSRCSRCFLDD